MRARDDGFEPDSPEHVPRFEAVPGIDVVDGELLPRPAGPVTPTGSG